MSTPAKKMPYTAEQIYDLAVAGKDIPVAFVDIQDKNGGTALHYASADGNFGAVQALLAAGAKVKVRDMEGNTAIYSTALNGNVDVIKALLLAGDDLDAKNIYGDTPLHCAARLRNVFAIPALRAAGADPNVRNDSGDTPLHCAALSGNISGVQALLAADADPNAKDNFGDTALHFAVQPVEYLTAVQPLLAAGADPLAKNNERYTPLHLAAKHKNIGVIHALLAAGAGLWEEDFAAARARNEVEGKQRPFSPAVRTALDAQEQSMLNEPLTWTHLNFNNFPQEHIAKLEACLVQLATHYQNHSKEEKSLTSLCLNGLHLTPTGEAALAEIIERGTLTCLSLANTRCDITADSLIGEALLKNFTITDLNISRRTRTPAMLTAVAPLILRAQLEKLTLLDPALSEASLQTFDDICFAAESRYKLKLPALVLSGNNPALFDVLKSHFRYLTTWVMPKGSLPKDKPASIPSLSSLVKTSIAHTFLAPPKAAVATAGRPKPPALLPRAQLTSGDDAVGVGSPHQGDTSRLNRQTVGLVASPQAEQGPGMPVVPSTEETATPVVLDACSVFVLEEVRVVSNIQP